MWCEALQDEGSQSPELGAEGVSACLSSITEHLSTLMQLIASLSFGFLISKVMKNIVLSQKKSINDTPCLKTSRYHSLLDIKHCPGYQRNYRVLTLQSILV